MAEKICSFCLWRGLVEVGSYDCPHCREENTLVYEDGYFDLQNNIEDIPESFQYPQTPNLINNSDVPETDDYDDCD